MNQSDVCTEGLKRPPEGSDHKKHWRSVFHMRDIQRALAHDAHQSDFLFRDLSWHFTNTTDVFPFCRRDTFSLEQKITLGGRGRRRMWTCHGTMRKIIQKSRLCKSHMTGLINFFIFLIINCWHTRHSGQQDIWIGGLCSWHTTPWSILKNARLSPRDDTRSVECLP